MEKHAATSESTKRFDPSAFASRKMSNLGRKFYLSLPDGTKTEEYFTVLGQYSDTVANALAEYRQDKVKNEAMVKPDPNFAKTRLLKVAAKAVTGWTFDIPFSTEAVEEFLHDAPHIAEAMDEFIYGTTAFFAAEG